MFVQAFRGEYTLLLPKYQALLELLACFQRAGRGQRHLFSIGGYHPAILLSDLIVALVNRIHCVRVHKLERYGVVVRVLQIVILAIEMGSVAVIRGETDAVVSIRLDFERQTLLQTGLAEVLSPLAGE